MLDEVELELEAVPLAELPEDEAAVDEAVEDESVAVAVDEPVVVLLALVVATAVLPAELVDTLERVKVTLVPVEEDDAAVDDADELLEEDDDEELAVMLNWFYFPSHTFSIGPFHQMHKRVALAICSCYLPTAHKSAPSRCHS